MGIRYLSDANQKFLFSGNPQPARGKELQKASISPNCTVIMVSAVDWVAEVLVTCKAPTNYGYFLNSIERGSKG